MSLKRKLLGAHVTRASKKGEGTKNRFFVPVVFVLFYFLTVVLLETDYDIFFNKIRLILQNNCNGN